jgi:hypothetical protein
MKRAALGGDPVVDAGLRVEGENDAPTAEAAQEVPEEVELQKAVQERGGEGREGVVCPRHQRRSPEHQLASRVAAAIGGCSLGVHQFAMPRGREFQMGMGKRVRRLRLWMNGCSRPWIKFWCCVSKPVG